MHGFEEISAAGAGAMLVWMRAR